MARDRKLIFVRNQVEAGPFLVRRTIRKERCRRPDSDPVARKVPCRQPRPDDLDLPIQALRRTKNGLARRSPGRSRPETARHVRGGVFANGERPRVRRRPAGTFGQQLSNSIQASPGASRIGGKPHPNGDNHGGNLELKFRKILKIQSSTCAGWRRVRNPGGNWGDESRSSTNTEQHNHHLRWFGTWGGQFYGPVDKADAAAFADGDGPAETAGWWRGAADDDNHTVHQVVGSFGAKRQDASP